VPAAVTLKSLLHHIGALTQSSPHSRFSLVVSEWDDEGNGKGTVVTIETEGERIARLSVSKPNSG
jgi:hypothetical protein